MTLLEKVEKWMRTRQLGQEEVANGVGVAQSTLSHFLAGKTTRPTHKFLIGIARMMGTSVDWLVDDGQGWPIPARGEPGVHLTEDDEQFLDWRKRIDRLFGEGTAERRLWGEPAEIAIARGVRVDLAKMGEGEPVSTRRPTREKRKNA